MVAAGAKHFSAALRQPSLLAALGYPNMAMPIYVAIAGCDSMPGPELAS